jgi:hypothetical protein
MESLEKNEINSLSNFFNDIAGNVVVVVVVVGWLVVVEDERKR